MQKINVKDGFFERAIEIFMTLVMIFYPTLMMWLVMVLLPQFRNDYTLFVFSFMQITFIALVMYMRGKKHA